MNRLARFDADMALAELRPAIRVAGFMVANGGTGYSEELDRLLSRSLVGLIKAHPGLDTFDIESEIADALADAAAEHQTAAYHSEAVRRSPGLLQRGRAPARALTGLPAYYPTITEPRDAALARQRKAIERTIRDGARIGAARRELARRHEAEMPFLPDPTPAAKAALTRRLHREVAGEFGFAGGRITPAPRMLVTGSQGTGKTAAALQALALVSERLAVRFAVPLLGKAAEALDEYRAIASPDSLRAMLVRGRAAADPAALAGVAMCPRHEAAEKVSQAGLSVKTTMCATCPLREACGYRRQEAAIEAMEGVGLFFMASAGLFSASPAPAADLLIVDERLAAEHVSRVSLDVLRAETLPYPGGEGLAAYTEAHITMDAVRDALAAPDQLATLRGEGITAVHLANAIRLLRPLAEPAPLPAGLTDAQLKAELAQRSIPAAVDALKLLRAVAVEFDQPRPWLNTVTAPDKLGEVAVCRLQLLHGIAGAAVLALDGTGNPDQVRHIFGARMAHVEARIERDAHVTSPLGKSYSRQSITGANKKGRPIDNKATAAGKLREEIAAIARRLPQPCLVVADKQAEAALIEHLASDTPTTHYGDLRGKNAWEHCKSVVTAGPAPIGLQTVEEMARCYMAVDLEPLLSAAGAAWPVDHEYRDRGWPFWCTRMRRMRDGSLQPVEVAVHPDPRVQAVLEQVREAEAVQAIDRTRPVWNRRTVVTLDSLVLDVTYDACPSAHRELMAGGSVWQRTLETLGILPLGARDLAAVGAFTTKKAAERALERAKFTTPNVQIESIWVVGVVNCYLYRPLGQAGGSLSRALIDTARHPDPRSALELLLGPLSWFELLPPAAPAPELPVASPPVVVKPIAVARVPRPHRRSTCKPPPALLVLQPREMPPDPDDDVDVITMGLPELGGWGGRSPWTEFSH